jgi:hypothetical protein
MARGPAVRLVLVAGAVSIGFLLWNHATIYSYLGRPENASRDQQTKAADIASAFQNERLKLTKLPDYPIQSDERYAGADGVWIAEPAGTENRLLQPEQVAITCTTNALYPDEHRKGECSESRVTLGIMKGIVSVMGPDQTVYEITKWDKDGLAASYTDNLSSKCHLQILTMSFAQGRVLVSDIPTNKQGCDGFVHTNSYRLVRGQYYVDTTPKNDGDKPYP